MGGIILNLRNGALSPSPMHLQGLATTFSDDVAELSLFAGFPPCSSRLASSCNTSSEVLVNSFSAAIVED